MTGPPTRPLFRHDVPREGQEDLAPARAGVVRAIRRSRAAQGKTRLAVAVRDHWPLPRVDPLRRPVDFSADKKTPPFVAPHSFWAVALAHPPSTRTLTVTRPSVRSTSTPSTARRSTRRTRRVRVIVVGDLPSQREAQGLLAGSVGQAARRPRHLCRPGRLLRWASHSTARPAGHRCPMHQSRTPPPPVGADDRCAAGGTRSSQGFTTDRPCQRKGNHPPGESARAEARLLAGLGPEVTVDLADWAELAEVTR